MEWVSNPLLETAPLVFSVHLLSTTSVGRTCIDILGWHVPFEPTRVNAWVYHLECLWYHYGMYRISWICPSANFLARSFCISFCWNLVTRTIFSSRFSSRMIHVCWMIYRLFKRVEKNWQNFAIDYFNQQKTTFLYKAEAGTIQGELAKTWCSEL